MSTPPTEPARFERAQRGDGPGRGRDPERDHGDRPITWAEIYEDNADPRRRLTLRRRTADQTEQVWTHDPSEDLRDDGGLEP
jgi:hypothetical protein